MVKSPINVGDVLRANFGQGENTATVTKVDMERVYADLYVKGEKDRSFSLRHDVMRNHGCGWVKDKDRKPKRTRAETEGAAPRKGRLSPSRWYGTRSGQPVDMRKV